MDFYQIRTRETKSGLELYPDFIVGRSKDLMVQGRSFYAIWDEERQLWSKDEYDVQRMVDAELEREAEKLFQETGIRHSVKYMRSFNSSSWTQFKKYIYQIGDNFHTLDAKLIFANTDLKKTDYASRRLDYALEPGKAEAWEELISTLYSPAERAKIEWAVGSIVSGDSTKIQKFLVFYGAPGTGKSTILKIIQKLFAGYTAAFDGKALGNSNAAFATEVFRHNPLVAIQHDGDLSKIEDNARLNSIIAHEDMVMNEKYKASYSARVNAMLFIGSNQPVRISDAKSGIIRRLIDVHPSGVKIPPRHYEALLSQIDFELGAIAHHCWQVYLDMGKNYYNSYRPTEMMLQTDVFFNFIEAHFDLFKAQNYTTLKQAYSLYKEFCTESGIERPLPQYKMREELRNYFEEFKDRAEVDSKPVRSLYSGFTADKFKVPKEVSTETYSLVIEEKRSLLDEFLADEPAQLAKDDGSPSKKWANVKTKLLDIDTSELHYVKVPQNHIVIDFDLKAINGTKSLERNLEAASAWPATYAELSQSGQGVHLHYNYTGDPSKLATTFADGIEVKVYTGDSSLRRRLSKCNGVPVSQISSGLPKKEEKKILSSKTMTSERGLRNLIERNLKKEIHPGTKPSVDFIYKILEDAHESGMKYDVTDMRSRILAFANNSTHQAVACIKTVQDMKFSSEDGVVEDKDAEVSDERLVFFDVEVYPNLFVVCWKYKGDSTVVKMINPAPHEIEQLFKLKLIGFNNRRYDNHIIYAASMGYPVEKLFDLSSAMIGESQKKATFAAAYGISYTDIYDFSSKKQSLKKFEIELGLLHMELDFPWDQPVKESDWPKVVDYCANDVIATEAVFDARKADFTARQILAALSGLSVNDTTQNHTAKIIFGEDKRPQSKFIYTDLSKEFDGYRFELGKSSYREEDPGEGGYVYAEPGIYENVALLDVASMHPSSIEILNLFGPYTQNYSDIKRARVAIKHKEYESARAMLNGKLAPFLTNAESDPSSGEALSYALKIVINIVYGLTSAKFDNPFRDIRNVDNIVAKRGALFMIDLKHALQEQGYTVAHIKTDSVKVPNADESVIEFVKEFGAKYGYEFEHEATYDKLCLVNDAVYIAGYKPVPFEEGYPEVKWTAVGAQFQHPYVYKELFSKEEHEFADYCEGRSVVKGAMYLDMSNLEEPDYKKMKHLGKTGEFVPTTKGGGILYRVNGDKYYAVAGTKGYSWIEAEIAKGRKDPKIDLAYFNKLKDDAIKTIEKYGSFDEFVSI